VRSREIGYNESFNGKLKGKLFNGEIFCTLREAQALQRGTATQHFRLQTTLPSTLIIVLS
jgi:hypothetical protein